MSITRKLVQFAHELTYNEIPSRTKKEAKRFLLDSIGCALAAVHNDDMEAAYNYINELGGREQATVIFHGTKTNLPNAALMNSLLIRAMDYNDIYWEQDPSHPSDLIPAALTPAEYVGASGKDLLIGIVVAYELEMRMCLAANPGVREVGWHHASLTQFISPIVAGRMLGLSEDQVVAAAGISGSSHFTLGGIVAGHLTNMKNTADPMATEAGVRAALLAQSGYTGPVELFEGKEGVFEVIANVNWNPEKMLGGLGEEFLTTTCGYKAFPTEALTHQPITAVLELMEEEEIAPHSVEEVIIETTTRGADILSDPSKYEPTTKETADHSLPYCIAVAVAKGNVLPSDFEAAALKNKQVWELLPKIKVVANDEIDRLFPRVKRAIATIKTTNGRNYRKQEDYAKGRAERPLSDEELVAKFNANAEGVLSSKHQDELVEATFSLEEFADIREYMPLLVRPA